MFLTRGDGVGGPFGTRWAPFAGYAFTRPAPEKESDGDFVVVGMRWALQTASAS